MNSDLTWNFDAAKAIVARGVSAYSTHKTPRLSERELAVLVGLGHGETINEIAKRLFMAPSTASTYRQRILNKLGFVNNAQIVLFVHNVLGR